MSATATGSPTGATAAAPAGDRLLSVEEARTRILDGVEALGGESVPLPESLGRVLAAAVTSRLTLPPWDNSAMDGFAVRAADVAAASLSAPVVLRVVGEAAAGHVPTAVVQPGTAVRILTGAPLADGANAVVPVEDTDAAPGASALPTRVAILATAPVGAHVRAAGSDLQAGARVLEPGTQVGPAAIAVAAAGGHGSLPVHRQPRVAVIATGDELAAPGAELAPAQIPDSNSFGIVAQAREAGAEARHIGVARDSLEDVLRLLDEAIAWADVVVVSGGVSVGAHDVVRDAFSTVGRMDLWRVAVQPGKPLAVARALRVAGAAPTPDAGNGTRAGDVLLFGLPGNPVSSFVTFELFVRPVVRRMCGHDDLSGREIVRARLAERVTKSPGRRAFLRVRLTRRPVDDPPWEASLAGGQGSHVLSALALADGLAVVDEQHDALPAGAEVDVLRLRWAVTG